MCATIFKEMNFWRVKVEVLAWSHRLTLCIFNAIAGIHTMHVLTYPKLTKVARIRKTNALSTIVKRYLNNIFTLKKLVLIKNPSARFTLKISANQDLEPMLLKPACATHWHVITSILWLNRILKWWWMTTKKGPKAQLWRLVTHRRGYERAKGIEDDIH